MSRVHSDGDVEVIFREMQWTFSPYCLIPASVEQETEAEDGSPSKLLIEIHVHIQCTCRVYKSNANKHVVQPGNK